jgi:hypothetical protein
MMRLVTIVGLTRRRLSMRPPRAPRAAAFVRALLTPYGRCERGRHPGDLPLVRARQTFVTSLAVRHVHTHVTIAPRIAIAFDRRPLANLVAAPASPAGRLPDGAPAAIRTPSSEFGRSGRDAIVLRLAARATRTERMPHASALGGPLALPARAGGVDPAGALARGADAAMPLARSRYAAPAPAVPAAGAAGEVRGEDTAERMRPPRSNANRPTGPALPLDEGEMQRVAARVIGSIDQRIAAARERLGRC